MPTRPSLDASVRAPGRRGLVGMHAGKWHCRLSACNLRCGLPGKGWVLIELKGLVSPANNPVGMHCVDASARAGILVRGDDHLVLRPAAAGETYASL